VSANGKNAVGNSVILRSGSVGSTIIGGHINTGNGNAIDNSVFIYGGTANNTVSGGYSNAGNATGNSVFVSGGTVRNNVYAGYASSGNATNNTVTLAGSPDLSVSNIFGGRSSSGDAFTGNTLNVHDGGHVVKSLQNFEYMNFFVPSTMGNGGVMVTATESANITNPDISRGWSF